MPRLTVVDPATATGRTKELLGELEAAFGRTSNLTLSMAVNPAVLEAWIALNSALGSTLSRRLEEQIAIAIAEANGCGYCLAAHTALGRRAGIEEHELAISRAGESSDPNVAAALSSRGLSTRSAAASATEISRQSGQPGMTTPTSPRSSATSF